MTRLLMKLWREFMENYRSTSPLYIDGVVDERRLLRISLNRLLHMNSARCRRIYYFHSPSYHLAV